MITASRGSETGQVERASRPLVTVVVPVFNGGNEIVDNVSVIRRSIEEGLPGEEIELVVVSDGSIDGTAERLLEASSEHRLRVIHYDRNLGKGYAVKLGALAARGNWVALVDADLDLDPGAIPGYLDVARREGLDFAIGSKRHPASVVRYPRSRRIASWCYQQLNRVLFQLDVRDTQVGLKVFRREVADEVLPLLLVKQFAFDLELLAVARAFGFRKVRELPVRLDYRFTGSQVRSMAVLNALIDTAAVFYRLRILRTYRRKRRLLGATPRSLAFQPRVSVVGLPEQVSILDYGAPLEHAASPEAASGEVVAVLPREARPSGNWLGACIPFLSVPDVAAVVCPSMAPLHGSLTQNLAAAVLESRFGSGSRRMRYAPGNIRTVVDYPAGSLVARREELVAARAAGVDMEGFVSWLAERGRETVYVPDTVVVEPAPARVHALFRLVYKDGRDRGRAARRLHGRSLSGATALSLAPTACVAAGIPLVFGEGETRAVGVALFAAFGVMVGASAVLGAARFRSATVGLLTPPALIGAHASYVAGFFRGLASRV